MLKAWYRDTDHNVSFNYLPKRGGDYSWQSLFKAIDDGGDHWDIVNLPAVAEEAESWPTGWSREQGGALCPDMYPTDALGQIKGRLGNYWWSALYQQTPILKEGGTFNREWFKVEDMEPAGIIARVRYWDLAATEPKRGRKPDWTVGVLLGLHTDGSYWILDVKRMQGTPRDVEKVIRWAAEVDGRKVPIYIEQESGAGGKSTVDHYVRRVLPGWSVKPDKVTGAKTERARPVSSMSEAGHFHILRSAWNKDFFEELDTFPFGAHDDQVDALSGAYGNITDGNRGRPLRSKADHLEGARKLGIPKKLIENQRQFDRMTRNPISRNRITDSLMRGSI